VTPRLRLAAAAAAAVAGGILFLLELDDPVLSVARVILMVSVGLVLVGAGLVAAANGADRTGVILVLGGAAWLVERLLQAIATGLTGTSAYLLAGLWAAFLVHAIVTFPPGRPTSRSEGAVVVAGYLITVGLHMPYLLVAPSLSSVGSPHRNVLLVASNTGAARWIGDTADVLTIVWAVMVLGLIGAKAWAASPAARRACGFVWVAGSVLTVNVILIVSAGLGFDLSRDLSGLWLEVVAGIVAVTLAASLFAARAADDRLVALVADLETVGPGATLRNALRRSLADPALDVVYLRVGSGGWIDEVGQPMTTPVEVAGRTITAIERGGKPIGALVHDPVLLGNPKRIQAAISAASLAIDSERLKAELRAQLIDVQVSRTRILEAADRDQRRVERNLHDGAQQRLVGLALTLRLASRKAQGDPAVTDLLAEAAGELDDALQELRELARGIHPAIVTDAGLGGALETLAERPGIPLDLSVDIPGRLPEAVEVGAYYLIAEAVANANKHAGAARVSVRAAVVDGSLRVAVSDDGRGGAAAGPGSGLEGLADRVGALGGHLVIESTTGSGTTVAADIPLRRPSTPDREGRRMTALTWLGWENWEAPAEAYDQLMDEDNFNHVKGVLACAGGGGQITQRERDWIVGYHTAAGTADWVLEAVRTYDAADLIEDIMDLPSMTATRRGVLYDAVRMCSSDGALTPAEIERVLRAADTMGLSRDVVADLRQVVLEEHALRRRRYELIVAPVLPLAASTRPETVEPDRPPIVENERMERCRSIKGPDT
jgi:signal transduction histidine kinase